MYIYSTTGNEVMATYSLDLYLLLNRSFTSGAVIMAFSCMIRPTAVVFWLPVIILYLYWLKPNEKLQCVLKLTIIRCLLMPLL